MTERDKEFRPLFAVPPGDTLEEVLSERQMSQSELARRMGRPFKTINEIIQGKAAIMPETAIQLERVLGIRSSFWSNLERQYREDLARLREADVLQEDAAWLDNFPLRELRSLGVLPKSRDKATILHHLLQFFGVASKEAWNQVWLQPQATFRQTAAHVPSLEATASWLRAAAVKADEIETRSFDRSAFLSVLSDARSLTREDPEDFAEPLAELCREVGVVVLFLRPFRGVRAFGATQWLKEDKALIQLSNRYKTDDHFWFSFFHEAGHIVLHNRREVFVENRSLGDPTQDSTELEADRFALDTLIPKIDWDKFIAGHPSTVRSVLEFSDRQGVSPGIVVGRLQHEGHWLRNQGAGLKRKFSLQEVDSWTA